MIEAEQVLCGFFNGLGWRIIKSPKIYQLSENSLKEILQPINIEAETRICRFLEDEHLVAISYLKPQQDEYGRKGVWNSTLLIPIRDYLIKTDALKLAEPYFMKECGTPPKSLESIKIE